MDSTIKALVAGVDWSKHSDCTCVCLQCSNQFRSCAKFVMTLPGLLSKTPCPSCGSHQLSRASGDPESQTITRG